jgi:hypothetical protein
MLCLGTFTTQKIDVAHGLAWWIREQVVIVSNPSRARILLLHAFVNRLQIIIIIIIIVVVKKYLLFKLGFYIKCMGYDLEVYTHAVLLFLDYKQ